MAPGPLGLCHPVPDDPALRNTMRAVAHSYAAVYRMYNFDWDPEPGTVQYKIDQRIRRVGVVRGTRAQSITCVEMASCSIGLPCFFWS